MAAGETLAIVGESGAGKTLAALSVLNLLPPGVMRQAGRIVLDGVDVPAARPEVLRRLRGGGAGMIFQESLLSLNPLQRVGRQVGEAMILHQGSVRGPILRDNVLALLREVGLADAARLIDALPHRLSGGQRQRVMIAVALAGHPKLLIADEPTAALDAALRGQVLELIARERRQRGLSVLLITHDLAAVRDYADRVLVLDRGRVVEEAPVARLFAAPAAAQTARLLAARHLPAAGPAPETADVVLSARGLSVRFAVERGVLRRKAGEVIAVDDVSFELRAGETLGLVGESGSGKSTIVLAVLRLIRFRGAVLLGGEDLARLPRRALRRARARLQVVFQDPYGSLSPRLAVGDIVAEGVRVHRPRLDAAARARLVANVLAEVGLPAALAAHYPHELSGGERQRVAIARALILRPAVLVLDEPTGSLDATVQAEILQLLCALQRRHGLAYLLISHDMNVIRAMAHRAIVLREGRVVQAGPANEIFAAPASDYTRALLAAIESGL